MSVGFIIMTCTFVNQHNRTNIPIDIEAKSVSSSENLQMKQIILNLLRSVKPPHGAALLVMHLMVLLICPSSKVTWDLRSVIRHQRCSSFTPWHAACSATHHFAAITPNTPLSSFSASLWRKGGTKKHFFSTWEHVGMRICYFSFRVSLLSLTFSWMFCNASLPKVVAHITNWAEHFHISFILNMIDKTQDKVFDQDRSKTASLFVRCHLTGVFVLHNSHLSSCAWLQWLFMPKKGVYWS